MTLNSIAIDSKSIIMKIAANKETDDDSNDMLEGKITAKEEPLESLTKAWNELPSVFCEILELPKGYVDGLTITKLTIRRTKAGTRSVILEATKNLECRADFLHTMNTPCVQIEPSTDGESGAVQIDKKLCAKVTTAIHEAEKYLAGDRSQVLMKFEDGKAALNATSELGKQDQFAM